MYWRVISSSVVSHLMLLTRVVAKLVWRALGALSLNVGAVRSFTMRQNCSIIPLYKLCQ